MRTSYGTRTGLRGALYSRNGYIPLLNGLWSDDLGVFQKLIRVADKAVIPLAGFNWEVSALPVGSGKRKLFPTFELLPFPVYEKRIFKFFLIQWTGHNILLRTVRLGHCYTTNGIGRLHSLTCRHYSYISSSSSRAARREVHRTGHPGPSVSR